MSHIKVAHGDVIGVAVQQSDLPMVQFLRNGTLLPECAVNRFRGAVYPAVALPEHETGLSLRFVFRDFKQSPPGARFCPVMVARGLV